MEDLAYGTSPIQCHHGYSGILSEPSQHRAFTQSTQVKEAGPDQQGLLVMNLCGLGLRCREFDRPARWV